MAQKPRPKPRPKPKPKQKPKRKPKQKPKQNERDVLTRHKELTPAQMAKAKELRDIREQLNLTQAKMAEALGLSIRGLRQFELGERVVSAPVQILARLLSAQPTINWED